MAISYIDRLQSRAFKAGIESNTEKSLKWFQKQLRDMKSINRRALLQDENFKARARPLTGRMFMYFYDPKTKKEMPYYDRFPLIFMVEKAKGGFYGLNLHYLPPKLRAKFFDRITDYTTNKRYEILRQKLDLEWQQEISNLEEDKLQSYLHLQVFCTSVNQQILPLPSLKFFSYYLPVP